MNPPIGTSSRGGGLAPRRGQGRGGRYPHFNKPREPPKPDLTKHPFGDLVDTISASDLDVGANTTSHSTEISGCEYVSSYNWTNDANSTIVVPGKPPKWTPLAEPQRLKEDSGQYFRDLNAAKNPSYPMAPAVHAVLEKDYHYHTVEIDIFACGSTLGNLLRFARGMDKPFRFNLQVIKHTVFLIRKENDPKQLIEGVRGYGHTFPEAYTTWSDPKNSISHQRIIRYKFGGLTHLLRFESDGYIPDLCPKDTTPPPQSSDDDTKNNSPEEDLILSSQDFIIDTLPNTPRLTIKTPKHSSSTTPTPQSTLFDLKTRSGKHNKKIDMTDIYPQLWLKRIPNFITAYHDGAGLFTDICVQNIEAEVSAWATENAAGIKKFAVLLQELVRIVRQHSPLGNDTLLEVYCPDKEKLEVRRQFGKGTEALPYWLTERWEKGSKVFVGSSSDDDEIGGGGGGDDIDDDNDDNCGGLWLPNRYEEWYSNENDEDFGPSRRYRSYYDSGSEPDYTACSASDCGYCGRCSY